MIEGLENIDIIEIIGADVELKKSGSRWVGRCPFHEEKTGSFFVFPITQTFHCFGCHAGRNVIDYVMKRHGLDFKGALRHLGIRNERPTVEDRRKRTAMALLRAKNKDFADWEWWYMDNLSILIVACHKALSGIRNVSDIERMSFVFHWLPILKYRWNLLFEGCKEEKGKLYREVGDKRTYQDRY